ncbi:EspG family protein [Streptoalloteichus tenebrarius]|uniref:EspG family protein n=1 Tax=Streptoalloteichus tenebrarius (strain ATCC 17920 / DSM 40477 / JCM 4838 / CBS 697.72 / NBRC 16177 / NCIMB 11028 / NRRL B-12390 / A12253. 1 / ISP 5477) TaxID=1933 RepID=A0ABT1HQK5_STRSD|nr:ESX secretion-associated protein EspG [Streptoalloteichus tenebrarius]MCP2257801.1 EspG family protein [Streptoalloteichus tenebrarius]
MAPSWRLTPRQLDQVWESLDLDGYPFPLEVRSHGDTVEERAEIRRRVAAELRSTGLLRGDQLDPDLEDALRALARPTLWLDAVWLPEPTAVSPFRMIAVHGRDGALVAVQVPGESEHHGGDLHVEHVPSVDAATAVVERLPAAPPGPRRAVSLPAAALAPSDQRRRADDDEFGGVLSAVHHVDTAARERRAYDEIMNQPRTRGGQIAANAVDPLGRRHRSAVLSWFDVDPPGRYALHGDPGPDGSEWITVGPADPARLRARLHVMVQSVLPRR